MTSDHTKLGNIPVLHEIFSYLDDGMLYDGDGVYDDVILPLRLVNRDLNAYIVTEMPSYWYTQLQRMAHKDMSYVLCFDYPECEERSHFRYKFTPKDPVKGFKGRDVYKEWRGVAWKRMKHRYWSWHDEKKIKKCKDKIREMCREINRLREKKEKGMMWKKRFEK